MDTKHQWHLRRIGIILGAWLMGLYALVAESVNRLALPEVPLTEPDGGLFAYLFSYLAVGAVLGFVCCWPSTTLGGTAAGGAAGAAGILLFNWIGAMEAPEWLGGMTIVTIISFLPITLMLSTVAYLVRFSADSLAAPSEPDQKRSLLRFWRPMIATAIFVMLGLSAMYPAEVRSALQETYNNVVTGLTGDVPDVLLGVWKFPSGADGTFVIEYSDRWQEFTGQYYASLDPLSAYLIKVRFSNDFVILCLYSSSSLPVCLNEAFPFGE